MTWLGGWRYRKAITLSRASGAVTAYQMRLLLGESPGASGEDVDCDALCKTDFSDIRFTSADGTTLLDYRIESITGASPNQLATIWIEFDSIGVGATTFFMYYGNVGASAVSSGVNTFPFFDDFSGASLDTDKWTDLGGTSISLGVLTAVDTGNNGRGIRGKTFFGTAFAARARIKPTHYNNLSFLEAFRFDNSDTTQQAAAYFCHVSAGNNAQHVNYIDPNSSPSAMSGAAANTWVLVDIRRNSSANITYLVDNSNLVTIATNVSTQNMAPAVIAYANGAEVSADWVLVRQFLATEPAWGAWGSEEVEEITDVAGIGDSVDAVSMSGIIGDGIGIGDAVDAYNTDSPIADAFGLFDLVDASGDWSVSDSDVAGIGDTADAGFEAEGGLSDISGFTDSIDGFNWSSWVRANRDLAMIRYYCTLTGAADSLSDLTIPISSFQASKRTGESTYLSVIVPGMALAADIAARSNGEIIVEMAYLIDGIESVREEILRVDLEQINPQEGARNRSITLIGHKTVTYDSRAASVQGCSYKYTSGGSRGFRFPQADPYLNPGDALTVVDTGDALTVDYITYAISAKGAKFMEVRE